MKAVLFLLISFATLNAMEWSSSPEEQERLLKELKEKVNQIIESNKEKS